MAPGFAHGYCGLSDWADLHYKVTRNYDVDDQGGLHWSDRDIGIDWPLSNPIITARDDSYLKFKDIALDQLPFGS
jgi:dTDP-4-dehydrorhamnose 3,5-epimerase